MGYMEKLGWLIFILIVFLVVMTWVSSAHPGTMEGQDTIIIIPEKEQHHFHEFLIAACSLSIAAIVGIVVKKRLGKRRKKTYKR